MAQARAKRRTAKKPDELLTFTTKRYAFDLHRQVRTGTAEIWGLVERGQGAAGEMILVCEDGCHAFHHVRVVLSGPVEPRSVSQLVRRLLLHLGIYAASVAVTAAQKTVSFDFEA
jgi:hypothetical protein